MAAILAAVGLHSRAPRRAPLLYLGPAAGTVLLITLATASVVAIWSP
jgi:hypothetical protein